MGRTGAVTPVANLEPVQLAGTTVRRATLHNAEQIALLDVRPNDMVYVEKGGEIIPKITGVELSLRPAGSRPFEYIDRCPVCGTPLVRYEGEAKHYCPNASGCRPQILGRIVHFIRRKAMDIDGLGEEIVTRLFDEGSSATPPTSTTSAPIRSPGPASLRKAPKNRRANSSRSSKRAAVRKTGSSMRSWSGASSRTPRRFRSCPSKRSWR